MLFTLLKAFAFLGFLAICAWWGATVPLGERTLFGHLRAIGSTKESQELVRGTKDKVTEVKERIANDDQRPAGTPDKATPAETAPPQDKLTSDDRKEMRRLIESKRGRP